MTVRRRQSEPVDLFEARDLLQCFPGEGLFALEGVQANALEQVAEPEVGVFGETFQHLEQSRLHTNSGLNTVDLNHEGILCDVTHSSRYHGTWVVIPRASEPRGATGLNDSEFLADLEGCRLPVAAFNHAAHVRLGYLCLREQAFPAALVRVRSLIKNYANSIGKGSLYDETITVAFLELIHEHLRSRGDAGGWDTFEEQNPELMRKDAWQR